MRTGLGKFILNQGVKSIIRHPIAGKRAETRL
jgi:hypothetical protein